MSTRPILSPNSQTRPPYLSIPTFSPPPSDSLLIPQRERIQTYLNLIPAEAQTPCSEFAANFARLTIRRQLEQQAKKRVILGDLVLVFALHADEGELLREVHALLRMMKFTGLVFWRQRGKERWIDGVGAEGQGHRWLMVERDVRWPPHMIMAIGLSYYFLTALIAWAVLERWWI